MSNIEQMISGFREEVVALTAQIEARNTLDSQKCTDDKEREVREFGFRGAMLTYLKWNSAILAILAGAKALEVAGVIK